MWAALGMAVMLLALGGCASRPVAPSAPGGPRSTGVGAAPRTSAPTAAPAATPGSAGPSTASGAPAPFASVIRGATRSDGLLPVWRREDRIWIELPARAFGQPFFLSPKFSSGIGEAGLFGGLMTGRNTNFGRPQLVRLRRVGNQIQLLAENAAYAARQGSAAAYAVTAAFSPSLLASAPVASQPDASGAVLVDAQALFLSDLQGVGMLLQRAFRQGYAFDARNSSIVTARPSGRSLVIEVQGHYATSSLSAAGAGGAPAPGAPITVPDARSLFITTHLTLLALPEQPMPPRLADARIGHFITTVADYSDDRLRTPRRHFVNRWRLDKRNPDAAQSPPVQPLVYWLDRSIPERYRATVRAGVLEWNRAFERIGIQGAIEVRDQPADGSIDTLEAGQASIRWMTNAVQSFDAIGPSHVDPRSGEILDADIGLESLATRAARARRAQLLQIDRLAPHRSVPSAASTASSIPTADAAGGTEGSDDAACRLDASATGLEFALDMTDGMAAADPGLDPDQPEVEAFVHAYLKYLVMHEVGHTLGLRHNFRASAAYDARQLADPGFTREHGTAASVMDYVAVNLPLPGQPPPAPYPTTLGPYDFWAIEYAYAPLPEQGGDEPSAALRAIADRVQQPAWRELLAYANDEDLALGLDPQALPFDLGRDAGDFARQRLVLVRDAVRRLERRAPAPATDAGLPRRALNHALNELARAGIALARQIGGVHTRRDAAGTRTAALQPVDAATQRAALDLLLTEFLRPRALQLSPALQQRLSPDFLERDVAGGIPTDFSLTQTVATLQRLTLSQLMSDETTASLLDSQDKDPQAFTLAELHQRLLRAVWLDAPPPGTPPAWTRELQREHVNRLAALIVRPGSAVIRAEARSVWLATGRELLALLHGQQAKARDALDREHLRDSADTLARALTAPAVRGAP